MHSGHARADGNPRRNPGRAHVHLGTAVIPFAERAARCGEPVLICGETGSGKTELAMQIHELSRRAHGPFVRVNCGAIPESLFEREMFGHVRGAFTDARESRAGLFEAADGGTLFLDEVGELPLQVQSKLLAALEERCVRRLGAVSETRVDVRVVAATNSDLREMMRCKLFREDLFHRLAVLRIHTPPLRERRQELTALIDALLARRGDAGPAPRVSHEALEVMRAYPWPGNLRELDNALRHAAAFADDGVIRPEHLPEELMLHEAAGAARGGGRRGGRRYSAPADPVEEKETIVSALRETGGNRTHAARRLGMSRSALWIKMQRYGLESPGVEHPPAIRPSTHPEPLPPSMVSGSLHCN
jgi:DNA-binding NtrC family response regulator